MTNDAARGAGSAGEDLKLSDLHTSRPLRASSLRAHAHTRLTRILLFKSAAEAIFVLALALAFYQYNIRAPFEGAVETFDGHVLKGWVVNERDASARVEVHLFVDGVFAGSSLAEHDQMEADASAGAQAMRQRFAFAIQNVRGGEHEARVYALKEGTDGRRVLRLLGEPLRFVVASERTE